MMNEARTPNDGGEEKSGDQGASEETERRSQLSLKAKVIMLSGILFISLIIAELSLRVLDKEVVLRHRMKEGGIFQPFVPGGLGDHCTPEFRVTYTINEFGFRDRPRSKAKDAKTRRVLLLGDSFSVGWGIPQNEVYGHVLETELKGFELWNTSRSGNNPLFYLAQSRRFSKEFDPDAYLVQFFDNDPKEVGDFARRFTYDKDGAMVGLTERYSETGIIQDASAFFNNLALRRGFRKLRRSLRGDGAGHHFIKPGRELSFPKIDKDAYDLAKIIDKPGEGFYQSFGFYFPERRDAWKEALNREKTVLAQLIKEVKDAKKDLAFLYIPHPLVFVDNAKAREMRSSNPHRALLQSLCRENSLLFVDATELLARSKEPIKLYFPLDQHLNPTGHKFLAEQLLKTPLKGFLKGS
ncbi:MAG: SGNH/GDSL hydrolase family protein [Planctomycetota bacterium]|nr:SGNH/GDSL hydrolase family protein [Planctomycetota bacterium]